MREFCWAEGPFDEITAYIERMERNGEVRAYWRAALALPEGARAIPYVRLRERPSLAVLPLGVFVSAVSLLLAAAMWAWEARYSALIFAGTAVLLGSLTYLAKVLRHGR